MLLCTAACSLPRAKLLLFTVLFFQADAWIRVKFRVTPASLSSVFGVCWGFFCLVGCLVGLLLLRQIYPCTKAVIFYNIGKVIWPSFFLLMGWGDCFLPGLSVSALYFWYMGLGLLDVSLYLSYKYQQTVSSFSFSCCRQSPVQHFRKSGYRPALMLWTCHLVLLAVLLVEK